MPKHWELKVCIKYTIWQPKQELTKNYKCLIRIRFDPIHNIIDCLVMLIGLGLSEAVYMVDEIAWDYPLPEL